MRLPKIQHFLRLIDIEITPKIMKDKTKKKIILYIKEHPLEKFSSILQNANAIKNHNQLKKYLKELVEEKSVKYIPYYNADLVLPIPRKMKRNILLALTEPLILEGFEKLDTHTKKELNKINTADKTSNSKSYDGHIKYNGYNYICPRYWCFKDDNNESRSISFKQINEGECGGWDALNPKKAKSLLPSKRIVELTDDRLHNPSKTNNPLVYKPLYPFFQKDKSKIHLTKFCLY